MIRPSAYILLRVRSLVRVFTRPKGVNLAYLLVYFGSLPNRRLKVQSDFLDTNHMIYK